MMKPYLNRLFSYNSIINSLEKRYNLNQLQVYESILNKNNLSISRFNSIFEFGCGSGRLIQYLPNLSKNAKIIGCDISAANILTCRKKMPEAQFIINNITPPLPFQDEMFDFIYSYSVFTHLSEENHKYWLKELARLLKPGGVMLHTTHPPSILKRVEMFSPEAITAFGVPGPIEDFISNNQGYYYYMDRKDLPEYGYTLISKEYILNHWPGFSGMKIIEYTEHAVESYPMGYHDIVLMMKS